MAITEPTGQPAPLREGEFVPSQSSQAITFDLSSVAPPSHVYIQRDDVIVFDAASINTGGPFTNTIHVRLLRPDGFIQIIERELATAGAGTRIETSFPLMEGYLLSVSVTGGSSNLPGDTFVRVMLSRGGSVLARASLVLIAGYVNVISPLAWPGSSIRFPREGPGNLVQLFIANPGAGVDFTTSLSGAARMMCGQATLTTSATVANRQVQLQFLESGGGLIYTGPAFANIPASTVATVVFSTTVPSASAIATDVTVPIPDGIVLDGQCTIQSLTVNLQAGDTWTNIRFWTERWVSTM